MSDRPPLSVDEAAAARGDWIAAWFAKLDAIQAAAMDAVIDAGIFDTLTEVLSAEFGEVSDGVAWEVFNELPLKVTSLLCSRYLARNPPPPLSEPQPFAASAAHMMVLIEEYQHAGELLVRRADAGTLDANDIMHLSWLAAGIGAVSEAFRANIYGFDRHHETANRVRSGGRKGGEARKAAADVWRKPLIEWTAEQRARQPHLGQKYLAKRALDELKPAGVPLPDDLDQVVSAIRSAERAGALPRSSKNPTGGG
jgi:hypothetical protein